MNKNIIAIDSFVQLIEESFSRASLTMLSCRKALVEMKDFAEAGDVKRISNSDLTNLEIINLISNGKITKKIEKIFWFRFFQFQPSDVLLLKNKISLSDERIFKIILKVWSLQLATDKISSLNALDSIYTSPGFFSRWVDLGNEKELTVIAARVGKSLLSNKDISAMPFKRASDFSLYLIVSYLFNNTEGSEFERVINDIEVDLELANLFPGKAEKGFGLSKINFIFIASLLKAVKFKNKSDFSNIHRQLLAIKDIKSFGDPRSYPLSFHWTKVEELESEGLDEWKKSFNEEDIVFFFKELNKVKGDRRDFWLKYKRTAQKVALVIDRHTYDKLEAKYSNDKKLFEIVKRAYLFNSSVVKISSQLLIILFFKDYVVVEGSDTGFGCQIYNAQDFQKKFKDSFFVKKATNIINENNYEKFRGSGSGRLTSFTHHTGGWESSFTFELQKLGIYKDK